MHDFNFNYVTELVRRLDRPIAFFDLETTTFRGRANFAIMECAVFVATLAGPGVILADLINPEREISSDAARLTGITRSMVAGKETWGARYAGLFCKLAQECWVTGFNNSTFDQPTVIEMNARYGQPLEGGFAFSFDVRRLFLTLSAAKSQKGSLAEVAAALGVVPREGLHRAEADIVLTVEVLNRIIEVYGLDAVHDQIVGKVDIKAKDVLSAKAIAKYVKGKQQVSMQVLCDRFQKTVRDISYEVGKAIDERLVDPDVFAHAPVQAWLDEALLEASTQLLDAGKLKPVYEALLPEAQGMPLDYIQLRIAMLRHGRSWASLKPLN